MQTKKKHMVQTERKKLLLSLNGEELAAEETASLSDASIKDGDKIVFSLAAPLED